MRKKYTLLIITMIIGAFLMSCNQSIESQNGKSEFTSLKGPYLGQKPPGDLPELFSAGVVADIYREHSSAAFTPDGKDVFWSRQIRYNDINGNRARVVVAMHMKMENGIWTKPVLAQFNNDRWTFITYISSDGKRVYFDRSRVTKNDKDLVLNSWYVEKKGDAWGEAQLFTELDKWEMNYSKIQVPKSGNIYFQSTYPKPNLEYESWGVGIFVSKLVNGEYQKPVMLDSTINSSSYLDYAFHVSPNEDFIIFSSSRPGGYSSLDLYISFRQKNDIWGEALNLGEKINSYGVDGSDWPFLSPDGKYLFFMTTMKAETDLDQSKYTYEELRLGQLANSNPSGKIHWVSTSFIEKLRPEHLKQMK